jgi:hypothetical protein
MNDIATLKSPAKQVVKPKGLGWEAQLERDLVENVYETQEIHDSTQVSPADLANTVEVVRAEPQPTIPEAMTASGTGAVFNLKEDLQSTASSVVSGAKDTFVESLFDILDLGKDVAGFGVKFPENSPKSEAEVKKQDKQVEYNITRGKQENTANAVNQIHAQKEQESNLKLAGDGVATDQVLRNKILKLSTDLEVKFDAYHASELHNALVAQGNEPEKTQNAPVVPGRPNLTMRQDAVEGQATTHGANANIG